MFYFRIRWRDMLARVVPLFLLYGWACVAQAEDFPLPDSLKPNVTFWKRVYTEIDSRHGFMHDAYDLSRVYETIALPDGRAAYQHTVKAARERLKKRLAHIATTPFAQLSEADKRLRQLFPAGADHRDIRAAARHIRLQRGQADKFEQAIRRSGYYKQYITQRLTQAGLPTELAALPFVESSFNNIATSHAGAAGIWQFMPATARRFMKVSHVIDERYDPYRASDAAVRLLQYNHSILHSWPLAITAYNHGVGGMRRAVRKLGAEDIGVIVKKYRSRTFGFASRNFYAGFLAALQVSQNAHQYFPGVQPYAAPKWRHFKLDHYVPAATLATALGVRQDQLKQYNPGFREPIWEGEKRLPAHYELRLPAELVTDQLAQQLDAIPLAARFSEQVPDKTYKVRRGDSLSRIAALYGVGVSELVNMNNLRSRHRIRVGQVLFLPQKSQVSAPAKQASPTVVAAAASSSVVDAPSQTVVGVSPAAKASGMLAAEPVRQAEPLVEDEVLYSVQQIAATDPAEYAVGDDHSIEVQAAETLGHYADWLLIPTRRLRLINGMAYRTPLQIGKRLRLDLSKVNPQEFEGKRLAYHKQLEDRFFAENRIADSREYRIKRGDSLWVIAKRQKNMTPWLILQHNPDVDFSQLKPGDKILLPEVVKKI